MLCEKSEPSEKIEPSEKGKVVSYLSDVGETCCHTF